MASLTSVNNGLGNSLAPIRKANTWTNCGILSVGRLGTNLNEIWIKIFKYLFKKIGCRL